MSDSDDRLFDIEGDVFTSREARLYLSDRGVANTVNLMALMRESSIFANDPDTVLVEVGFRRREWRISRRALDAYLVWYGTRSNVRERRLYKVMWTPKEWSDACDVLTALGIPVPGRVSRIRDKLYYYYDDEGNEYIS